MTERFINLVVPLAHKATAMRITETADSVQVRPGAVSPLIGQGLRRGDVDSTIKRSTLPTQTMPGIRTSTTATIPEEHALRNVRLIMNLLTNLLLPVYSSSKCVRTRVASGMHPRQSDAFFTPIAFSMGAVEQEYKTRKGNTARWACYQFLTLAPTISLKNELVDFSKSQQGAIMSIKATGVSAPCIDLTRASPAVTITTDGELIVRIRPYDFDSAEYQGTRAQLEAENIIQEGLTWPESDKFKRWETSEFTYTLYRSRQKGMKGPKKLWAEGDWWTLRWEPINQIPFAEQQIKRKAKELADTIHYNSPKGQAESERQWERRMAACRDKQFQAFKALVPGLVRPKRKPRSKTHKQHQGAVA